ncbi:sigma-54-dependent Fis family transcriptional regulator [Aquabacterium sp.]|uniref:sigma-54-dependent Fis family transcriptional regulator n=1 Tax=Aquabacterium sp. TaxID=1872578 RepID=UPI0035B1F69E
MPLPASPPATDLRQVRQRLLESGDLPNGVVDERLSRSWLRSRHAGLSPVEHAGEPPLCSATELRLAIQGQHDFLAQAKPVMEFVFDQIKDSGNLVVLSDARGLLIHSMGDPDFVPRADSVSLRPGALWHEADRGTNAIGTALAEEHPIVIHGEEHYLDRNSFLTCAAAPVRGSDGKLRGVLDISGDQRGRHPHTFALVRSAARMIEDRLFHARHHHDLILHLHTLPEGLGGVGEGLLALSDDGWLIGANSVAQHWLRIDGIRVGSCTLEELAGISLRELPPGQVLRIPSRHHRQLFGRLDTPQKPAVSMPATGLTNLLTPHAAQAESPPAAPAVDPRLIEALRRALRVQAQGIAVLIQGESGTGKEVFARHLHEEGERSHQPFVALNCAALPETLIEAELFGYVGGAFTGARREGSPGRIREADGGTLFLDEIGDMPLALQARLLRVLQDRMVLPLGGSKPVPVDFVLVCATHRQLREAVRQGSFREDLYYRLNGLTVTLPALRERQDIPRLISEIIEQTCATMGRPRIGHIRPDLLEALCHHHWPGNLRQLHSLLRTACALAANRDTTLDWHHLPDDMSDELREALRPTATVPLSTVSSTDTGIQMANLRKLSDQAILQVVSATAGNMSEAARRLGISRNTLYRRLKQAGI